MTITEARNYYRGIAAVLQRERAMRARVLSEPRKSIALREIDDAKVSLAALGQVVQAASEASLLDQIYEQAPLLDLPPAQTTY